jgi:hypothetical protein
MTFSLAFSPSKPNSGNVSPLVRNGHCNDGWQPFRGSGCSHEAGDREAGDREARSRCGRAGRSGDAQAIELALLVLFVAEMVMKPGL